VVTNGLYATGGRALYSIMTNRVAITKPVLVRSVNGPQFTFIRGRKLSAPNPLGPRTIRCVYLTNGATLSGFTLTNGGTLFTSAPQETRGGGVWCESTNAMLTNCVIIGNSAYDGGGANGGTLQNCTLKNNTANTFGGAAHRSVFQNCLIADNTALYGGGASESLLQNSLVTSNLAIWHGGGTYNATIYNCLLAGNHANSDGGAADFGLLVNCTIVNNSADYRGGGTGQSTVRNCIVYANTSRMEPITLLKLWTIVALSRCLPE